MVQDVPKAVQVSVLGCLGAVLGSSRFVLGPSWGRPGFVF